MMRASPQVDLLTELHRLSDDDERTAAFRKAMADLAALAAERRSVPLEGLDPAALCAGVDAALRDGLVDDLSFLSPAAAAAALYQLAAGLPKGSQRGEVGRRVLDLLQTSTGSTFTALSASLALGSRDPFQEPRVAARVALAMEAPLGESPSADALALALVSRPHLRRAWLVSPSTAGLPGRRLAARLLDRAVCEAIRRATQGDDGSLQVFSSLAVKAAWTRLLSDRESLVWRHAATARGLLSVVDMECASEIDADLDESLTPTEWRRASVSLVASIGVRPQAALRGCLRVLDGPLLERDPGLSGVMMFGMARAAEAEPRACLVLIERLIEESGDAGAEELLALVRERVLAGAEERLLDSARAWAESRVDDDESSQSQRAITRQLVRELGSRGSLASDSAAGSAHVEAGQVGSVPPPVAVDHRGLNTLLEVALAVVAEQGPGAAESATCELLAAVTARVEALEAAADVAQEAVLLRELDLAVCQRGLLERLLMLSEHPLDAQGRFDGLVDRLSDWLLARVSASADEESDAGPHMRRLVTLLHVVDGGGKHAPSAGRKRQLVAARGLLRAVGSGVPTGLSRVVCATLSRAFDALVRDEVFEVSDVILGAALFVPSDDDVHTLAEASMDPQVEAILFAYAWLMQTAVEANADASGRREALDAVASFTKAVPVASSPRVEALRQNAIGLHQSLEGLSRVPCLWGLVDGPHGDDLRNLAEACQGLAQLSAGAGRRWDPDGARPARLALGHRVSALWDELERALSDGDGVDWARVMPALSTCAKRELPAPFAQLVMAVVQALTTLPAQAPASQGRSVAPPAPPRRLPGWLPPSRMLGGFYVLETLGEGAVGSVFIATRVEDRGRINAPRFALKVPAYDGQAARALSEEEFLTLFRREAGALLSLPQHPNLASFVTFDAGARPKPVLVMQLVEGPSLARLLGRGRLTMSLALDLLDGVVAGLLAMRELGIGHLDVKPGNIIVHTGEDGCARPVLVDFGLSGRKLRPGCATTSYGAPEVWGLLPEPDYGDPGPADVYAFACVVYETLVGRDLFPPGDEMATISAHISHDGSPPRLEELASAGAAPELVALLVSGLRKNPRERVTLPDMRQALDRLRPVLTALAWPLLPRARGRAAAA